jgi:hypothetical protein
LRLREVGGSTSLVELPSEVIQRASIVVNDVTQKQPPEDGEGIRNVVQQEHDAVTACVVVLRELHLHREVRARREFSDVVSQHERVHACHAPLQPGALEGFGKRHSQTGLIPFAELPLGTLDAVGDDLTDVGEEKAPELAGARRAPALGAGQIESGCLGLRHLRRAFSRRQRDERIEGRASRSRRMSVCERHSDPILVETREAWLPDLVPPSRGGRRSRGRRNCERPG